MDIECCTKNVALKTENETQNREQWRHVFSDNWTTGTDTETTAQLVCPWVDTAVLMESTPVQSQYNANILNTFMKEYKDKLYMRPKVRFQKECYCFKHVTSTIFFSALEKHLLLRCFKVVKVIYLFNVI